MTRPCDYCGLPAHAPSGDGGAAYCCLGCRIADGVTRGDQPGNPGNTALRLGLALFFSMNVMVCSLVLWSWETYAIAEAAPADILRELLRLLAMICTTPVLWLLGAPLVASLADQWRARRFTTDGLLLAGVLAAFGYSVASICLGAPHIYFEVACMILLAVTLGRWLEAEGKQKAMQSLQSLRNLLPQRANVLAEGGALQQLPLEEVQVGMSVRVLPGERVPLDGTIVAGSGYVDESFVSGESEPVSRQAGDAVFAGTLNLDGCLDVRAREAAGEGIVTRLIEAVREAAQSRSRAERQADRLTRIFLPAVTVAVLLTFGWHFVHTDLRHALLTSMSVALIACPCALAIATPLAVWAALGTAVRGQVVFRKSDDLLALAGVHTVCFDKTGTLTRADRRLCQATFAGDRDVAATVAKQLAQRTSHPLASALASSLPDSDPHTSAAALDSVSTVAGRGVVGRLCGSGQAAVLGSRGFCESHGLQLPGSLTRACEQAARHGWSTVLVGWGDRVEACFAFEERLRPDAAACVAQLKSLGVGAMLLSGDQDTRVARIAAELGIEAHAAMLPEDKQQMIRLLQANGRRVAMVGDGLNDAPGLGAADVGVAMGCGVEVTRDAADVCLMSSQLAPLPWAIELARRTRRTVTRNLAWSLVYNLVGIGLAATGRLNPILAALAMVLSSGFVIAESLRLTSFPLPVAPPEDRASRSAPRIEADPHKVVAT